MAKITRVVVRQAGIERKLLKIEEGPTGKLTIAGDILDVPGGPNPGKVLIRDKISVHLSEKAETPIRYLHATQIFPGQRKKELKAALPIFSEKDFIYPVMARIVGNLAQHGYNLVEKAGEVIVPLNGYDPRQSVMQLFCLITEPSVYIPPIHGLRKTIIRFSKFNLVFFHTFSDHISPIFPVFYNFATEPPIIDGVAQPGQKRWIDSPLPLRQVNATLTGISNHLIDSLLASAAPFYAARNQSMPYPPRVDWRMSPSSAPYDEADMEYGIHGVILGGDRSKMLRSILKRVSYSGYSETSFETMLMNLEAWRDVEMIDWTELEELAGGDVETYLRSIAEKGILPTR